MSRIFSDEELRIGAARSVDALCEAIDADDTDAALGFAKRLRREVLSMFGSYAGWETTLLETIRRRESEAGVRRALDAIEDPDSAPERCERAEDPTDRWRREAREIFAAIETGNTAHARSLARTLHEDALAHHDRGMSRVAALLSYIGRDAGVELLEAALDEAMSSDLLGDASFRERAEALMHFTRVHLQPFSVEEDDEKLTFLCPVCPSGGRLLREGHYEAPRDGFMIPGPRPLTWGRDSLPVYCAHEPVMERASIASTGVPLFIVEPSEDLGRLPCRTYLYKDPAAIPERFYRRLGLEKPKP